jgi:hypothetical protein
MAGQDLLDERRSRSRHADDEDGTAIPRPGAGVGGKQSLVENVDNAVHQGFFGGDVVLQRRPLQAVGGRQVHERAVVFAQVPERLGDGKVQEHRPGAAEFRAGPQPFQFHEIGVAGPERPDQRIVVPGLGVAGIDRKKPPV